MSEIDDFLKNIGKIESNNGQNTNHKMITSGIQKGTRAIGTYGLMPNTVDELVNSSKDPDLQNLIDMSPEEKKNYIEKNPEVERTLATQLAQKVLTKQGGDPEKAAFAWNQGHNLSPDQVADRDYQNSDYVQKFKKLEGAIAPSSTPKIQNLQGGGVVSTPLNVAGTPAASKIQSYLDSDSSDAPDPEDMGVKALFDKQQDDLNTSISKTRAPAMTEPGIVPQETTQPAPQLNDLSKLRNLITPKSVQPINYKNPSIIDVLNKIKGIQ